jgi:hypothetical protein
MLICLAVAVSNALAYYSRSVNYKEEKVLMPLTLNGKKQNVAAVERPGPNVIKLFTDVIYEFS